MAKTLSDGRIQVEAGDTLSGIYGADWQKMSGYTGDPRKLQIGTVLPAKAGAPASLEGTLPQEQPTDTGGRTLPEAPTDQLSSFRNLLDKVSKRASEEAIKSGASGFADATGFDPSKVSGGTMKGILDFVGGQKTTSIAEIYKQTTDFFDNQQKQAQDQLEMLIDANAMGDLTDSALSKLSAITGADYELLDGIRQQQKLKKATPKYFQNITRGGKEYRIGFDDMGNIISETVIGDGSGSSSSGNGFTSLTDTEKGKVVGWMSQQPGFDSGDLKKMDEDENFYNFIISEYYKANAL